MSFREYIYIYPEELSLGLLSSPRRPWGAVDRTKFCILMVLQFQVHKEKFTCNIYFDFRKCINVFDQDKHTTTTRLHFWTLISLSGNIGDKGIS